MITQSAQHIHTHCPNSYTHASSHITQRLAQFRHKITKNREVNNNIERDITIIMSKVRLNICTRRAQNAPFLMGKVGAWVGVGTVCELCVKNKIMACTWPFWGWYRRSVLGGRTAQRPLGRGRNPWHARALSRQPPQPAPVRTASAGCTAPPSDLK
jgi:hypothetical protein